jgi:hypothetical protein
MGIWMFSTKTGAYNGNIMVYDYNQLILSPKHHETPWNIGPKYVSIPH